MQSNTLESIGSLTQSLRKVLGAISYSLPLGEETSAHGLKNRIELHSMLT